MIFLTTKFSDKQPTLVVSVRNHITSFQHGLMTLQCLAAFREVEGRSCGKFVNKTKGLYSTVLSIYYGR